MNSLNSFQIVDIVHPRNRISLHIGQWWQEEEDTRQEHEKMHSLCCVICTTLKLTCYYTFHEHIYVDLSKAKNRCCAILSRFRGLGTNWSVYLDHHYDHLRAPRLPSTDYVERGEMSLLSKANNIWILIKLRLFYSSIISLHCLRSFIIVTTYLSICKLSAGGDGAWHARGIRTTCFVRYVFSFSSHSIPVYL